MIDFWGILSMDLFRCHYFFGGRLNHRRSALSIRGYFDCMHVCVCEKSHERRIDRLGLDQTLVLD